MNRQAQAERQLILISAGTAVRRQAMLEQAERLAGEVDWHVLTETLRHRKLLPTLGPRILELAKERVNESFATTVEQAVAAARRQGAFLQLVAVRIMTALADAEIPCVSLKGPILAENIYGDPGRRISTDIDLLVPTEHLEAAAEVVRGLGYLPPTDYVQDSGLPLLHFVLVHERGELPPVELHWRVHWYEQRFARERLLPPTAGQEGQWRPAPADELTSLLLFYARDGFIDLRLATDLGAWWDVHGPDLDPGALDEVLRAFPPLTRVIPVAATVAERIVGLPTTQIIETMSRLDLRDRMAVRLANPNPHTSRSQLYADMGLIDGLLMPPGDFRAFVRRQVLPPSEVLDEQARHAAKPRARSAFGHCTGVLARYGLRIARMVRAPEALC